MLLRGSLLTISSTPETRASGGSDVSQSSEGLRESAMHGFVNGGKVYAMNRGYMDWPREVLLLRS